jgi:anti-sigma regulatory factor (Ser/Thr protein kinase)
VAVLLVSEIFGNSVRHSGSGAPGETVTVAVIAGDGVVRVEVTDRAGPGTPELRPAGRDAEGGRGLLLFQGWTVSDPVVLTESGARSPLGETESLVRLPARMRAIILEALSGDGSAVK